MACEWGLARERYGLREGGVGVGADRPRSMQGEEWCQVIDFHRVFFDDCSERFDRTRFIPYTSVFVRDAISLSGAAPVGTESLSWKGIIFSPGTK